MSLLLSFQCDLFITSIAPPQCSGYNCWPLNLIPLATVYYLHFIFDLLSRRHSFENSNIPHISCFTRKRYGIDKSLPVDRHGEVSFLMLDHFRVRTLAHMYTRSNKKPTCKSIYWIAEFIGI